MGNRQGRICHHIPHYQRLPLRRVLLQRRQPVYQSEHPLPWAVYFLELVYRTTLTQALLAMISTCFQTSSNSDPPLLIVWPCQARVQLTCHQASSAALICLRSKVVESIVVEMMATRGTPMGAAAPRMVMRFLVMVTLAAAMGRARMRMLLPVTKPGAALLSRTSVISIMIWQLMAQVMQLVALSRGQALWKARGRRTMVQIGRRK